MDIGQTNSRNSDNDSDIQKINIIEEMNSLNESMRNSSNEVYKASSLWDKLPLFFRQFFNRLY